MSFEREDYRDLERIAAEKRVSVAWVVREAVSKYLTEQTPLFREPDARQEGSGL